MQPTFLLRKDSAIMPAKKFAHPTVPPEGFLYQPDFLSGGEEAALLRTIETLQFGAYDFRGYIAKRRVVAYGEGYDSGTRRMAVTDKVIPDFLSPIRDRAAVIAGMPADEFVQALVTEYSVGTPIGWHRDSPQFETIIGISLRRLCRLRLKPYQGEGKIISVTLDPPSIYVMRGPVCWHFQHSIPTVKDLRYSITLRRLSKKHHSRAA
jgi:alkylated DNA repair dioxygenase AlkB